VLYENRDALFYISEELLYTLDFTLNKQKQQQQLKEAEV
jgi:hypothetical protein